MSAVGDMLGRLRAKYPWFDHVWRAQVRYRDSKGDFYAAGLTYYTLFALFPLLMVAFAAGGFVLAGRPQLLADLDARIRETISGDLGTQVVQLMDSAIASRTSVGVIALLLAAWAGLGWMANLREALTQMWGSDRTEPPGFVRGKFSDLLALVSMFLALTVTIGLTALGNATLWRNLLRWIGIDQSALVSLIPLLVSLVVSWLLFTWMITRLPREPVTFASGVRAGLIAALGFEAFKQVAAIYLDAVMVGPAGVTFGPVLGLMVFVYVTARLVLFATAWAATSVADELEAGDTPDQAKQQ